MSPYAEGTKVPVDKTQAEIRALVKKHGATQFALGEDHDGDQIAFTFRSRRYGFLVRQPINDPPGERRWYNANRYANINEQAESEWRRRWRARLMWLKMVLEYATEEGFAEADQALAGFLLLPDGRTVADLIAGGGVPLLSAGDK